jgi:PRTRC genetic system protein C
MARFFVYDQREFPDPDPNLAVEDVRKQLAEFFPELTNADTREEKRGEDTVYTFSKRIGTKGTRRPDIVAIVRRVPEKRLRIFALAGELIDAG